MKSRKRACFEKRKNENERRMVMKNTRPFAIKTRVLSFILTLLLIFYAIPATVFAEVLTVGTDETQVLTDTAENFDPEVAREIYEVEELREENAKHFRLEDGSYLAASYVDPVHYLDEDGKWQDIDNRLFSVNGEFSTSNARVKFAKKITGNENLFTLHDGNAKITMGLLGAKKQTEGKVTTDYLSDDNEETKLGKMTNLEKLMSKIVYEDVLDGVDIEYVVHSLHVKENIKVKERAESYSYSFSIKLNKLTAELLDGGVIFKDDEGTVKYKIPSPIVYDSVGQIAPEDAAYYTLSGSNNKYYLTVTVDPEWMNREDILFPVTVDPTVEDASTTKSAEDVTQSRSVTDPYLVIASAQTPSYVTISDLPEISPSNLITNAKVNFRYMRSSGRVFPSVAAYNVVNESGNITQGSTIIDYEVGANPKFTYTFDITYLARTWYTDSSAPHTFALSRYVTAGEDLLVTGNGGIGVMHLYSTDSIGTYSTTPYFEISYEMMYGLEDYWTYTSQSAGAAGSGHVNLATGNLVFAIDTLTSTDQLMPVTATLVYNSALAGKSYNAQNAYTAYNASYMPYGFKLNLCETIITQTTIGSDGNEVYSFMYTDADGTTHIFKPLEDEDGSDSQTDYLEDDSALGLKMNSAEPSSATITITDKNKTVRTFNKLPHSVGSGWHLSRITDKTGNSVNIGFDSSYRPTSISIQPNGQTTPTEMLSLVYYSDNLAMIRNKTSGDAVIFKYSDTYNGSISSAATKYLRQVIYANGKNATDANWQTYYLSGTATNITVNATATYNTDLSGRLVKVKDDLSGRYILYSYSGNTVSYITEYSSSDIVGQKVGIICNYGNTKVRTSGSNDIFEDDDDIYTNYLFDDKGRCISRYSTNSDETEVYGAISGRYETQDNAKNNLKEIVEVGGSATNLLLNGGFEKTELAYWSSSVNVSQVPVNYTGNFYEIRFMVGANSSDEIYQYVFLPVGTYTLSLNYNVSNFENAHLYLKATPVTGNADNTSKELAKDVSYETDVMTDSLCFNVTNAGLFKISALAVGNSNLNSYVFAYVDNFVLTEGISAAPLNMVNGGHFSSTHRDNAGTVLTNAPSLWDIPSGGSIITNSDLYDEALKIESASGAVREAKQRIYEAHPDLITRYDFYPSDFVSNANRSFVVSGFGYSSAYVAASAQFGLRVDVYYYQGDGKEDIKISHSFPFQNLEGIRQFVSGAFDGQYYEESTNDDTENDDTTTESDKNDYRCIHYIDIVCEYSNQTFGYALFDNISVTDRKEYTGYLYGYYSNGLIKKKIGFFNSEYYYYDNNDNLTMKANDRGEIYRYEYDNNQLVREAYYTFVNGVGNVIYPGWLDNPESYITATPVRITEYNYNSYGLLVETIVSEATGSYPNAVPTNSNVIRHNYCYSTSPKIFGALESENDYVNAPIYYFRDETNGRLLATIQDGVGMVYTYDVMGRMTSVKPATGSSTSYSTVTNAENVSYTYNSLGYLTQITTDSTTYTFTYDGYGNTDKISVGGSEIADYEYYPNNGKLKKVIYANGFAEEYVYDSLDRLSEMWYHYSSGVSKCAVRYFYTTEGQLQRMDDVLLGRSRVYVYNTAGQVKEIGEFDTDDLLYDRDTLILYDTDGRITSLTETIDYLANGAINKVEVSNHYSYTNDGRLTSSYISSGIRLNVTYEYDLLNRISSIEYVETGADNFKYTNDYTYINDDDPAKSETSYLITKHTSKVEFGETLISDTQYEYEYDDKGNIIHIKLGTYTIDYFYDDLGQLIRENNPLRHRTILYTYDNAGNIATQKIYSYKTSETITSTPTFDYTYGYSSSAWGDQLLTYGTGTIEYDAVGNPTKYYNGATFGWTGRRLTSAYRGGKTYTFVYNSDGLRTEKTVNGVVHKYYYSGNQLLAEEWGEHLIIFLYDANGLPVGMKYRTTSYASGTFDTFWYERNLQGDIVAIYGDNGKKYVSYYYDAWGNHTEEYFNSGATVTAVKNNPLRYRGYYYDIDLQLYYLQSRYYDSSTGRFINADGYISTGTGILGYNMYAYCNNNPVMCVDPNGNSLIGWMVAIIVGYAIISNVASVIESKIIVANSTVEPMNGDDYNYYKADDTPTYGLSTQEKVAYIKAYRDDAENEKTTQNWSEAEMLRELNYHEDAYPIVVFFGSDPNVDNSWADRLEHVDFEKEQTFTTYLRRFLGNMIP